VPGGTTAFVFATFRLIGPIASHAQPFRSPFEDASRNHPPRHVAIPSTGGVVVGVVCPDTQPATTSATMTISPSHDARRVATEAGRSPSAGAVHVHSLCSTSVVVTTSQSVKSWSGNLAPTRALIRSLPAPVSSWLGARQWLRVHPTEPLAQCRSRR